jgi:hypothetical protein
MNLLIIRKKHKNYILNMKYIFLKVKVFIKNKLFLIFFETIIFL